MTNVFDAFAGLGGWSEPWKRAGHNVITLDIDPKFGCDITADIMDLRPDDLPWPPAVFLASPPCEMFSTGGFHQRAWSGPPHYYPNSAKARAALAMVERTCDLADYLKPEFAFVENPRGLLRKMFPRDWERRTVWYCHAGDDRAKPTDLWSPRWPSDPMTDLFRPCHNARPSHDLRCCCRDHRPAPRGSVTGTQGMPRAEAAKVPYGLAVRIMDAVLREEKVWVS